MLGENHSLIHDFPEYRKMINHLNKTVSSFSEKNERYTSIDKEIRTLEQASAPIVTRLCIS